VRVLLSAQIRRWEFGKSIPAEDLLILDGGDLFLLFYRGKDDPLGRNVSLSNTAFRKALDTHLSLLEADIARGDIEPVILP
jgi:hypothetical protein